MQSIPEQAFYDQYLRNPLYRSEMLNLAGDLIDGDGSGTAKRAGTDPFMLGLAERLAQSRQLALETDRPLSIGIVFGMWRETRRLTPQSDANPWGEDCLRFKIQALHWLLEDSKVDWHLYAVDDGCPEGSFDVASSIVRSMNAEHKVTVTRLADGIPFTGEPLASLQSTEESVKGGAVLYGLLQALADGHDIVGYTDCDNSVHLGQLGLFFDPILNLGKKAVFGDRGVDRRFPYWHSGRATSQPGARLMSHMRSMLIQRPLPTRDIFSPCKFFAAAFLKEIIGRIATFDFAFDVDVTMAVLAAGEVPAVVGYISPDSFEDSAWNHFGDHEVWHQKLIGIIRAARAHGIEHHAELAEIVETLVPDAATVQRILDLPCPPQLAHAEKSDMGSETVMPASLIRSWLNEVL